MNISRTGWDDLKSLLIVVFTIPLVWVVLLGWRPSKMIPVHDGIMIGYPLYDMFFERGPRVEDNIYSASWKGGSEIFEIGNFNYDLQFMSWLGLGPQSMTNLHTFLIQILCALLSLLVSRNFVSFLSEKPIEFTTVEKIGGGILSGFSPILAWRLGMGHDIIAMGALAFLVGLLVLTSNLLQNWTVVAALTVVATLSLTLQCVGQQTLVYSLFFGLPFFIAVISISPKKALFSKSSFLLTALLLLSAVFVSMPKFWPFLGNAFGIDALRQIGKEVLTYSYLTATFDDWLGSVLWSRNGIPAARDGFYHHEVHYALGPFLLLLWLFPFHKIKNIHRAFCVSVIMVLLFSMNILPFSDLMLESFPLLKSFRVPERSVFSVGLFLPVMALVNIAYWSRQVSPTMDWRWLSAGLILGLSLFFTPATIVETTAWVLTLFLFIGVIKKRGHFQKLVSLVFPILVLASLYFFKEKFSPFAEEAEFGEPVVALGKKLKLEFPELRNPLHRVVFEGGSPYLGVNTAVTAGISILDGYWFQPSRFTYVVAALQGRAPFATENFHAFPLVATEFPVLQQLYNVTSVLRLDAETPKLDSLPSTNGPVWFAGHRVDVDSFERLGQWLRESSDLKGRLQTDFAVVTSDRFFEGRSLPSLEGNCQQSVVKRVSPQRFDQEFVLEVKSSGRCPLIVATNFVSNLRAMVLEGALKDQWLEVFPANGSVTGIVVPAAAEKILLMADVIRPLWCEVLFYLGFVLFGLALFLLPRRCSN